MRKQIRSMHERRGLSAGSAAYLAKRLLPLVLLALWAAPSYADLAPAAPSYPNMAPIGQYQMASQAAEIAMARSAAPKAISDDATILTLGKSGYETAVKGSNEFTCLVGRSWMNDFDATDFWDPRDLTPNCLNAAAVKSVLPEFVKRTQWVLAGVSKDEMAARTKAAWASHELQLPAPGSVDYMMSKDQCIHAPSPCNWYPHVMFFVATADAQKWGDNLKGVPVFSGVSHTDPVTTFMVVVPKWSDGSPSPYVAPPSAATETHHHG